MACACMAASGVGSQIFIDDVTHDGRSTINNGLNNCEMEEVWNYQSLELLELPRVWPYNWPSNQLSNWARRAF